ATAADCIGDAIATVTVLVSTAITYATHFAIDGYCGVLVSVFIIFAGVKSLWEVLGRIMGKSADTDTKNTILQTAGSYPEIISIHDLMLHDYGFGYFVVSMRIEGYKKDSGKLYTAAHRISFELYRKFHCDCFIQIDYLLQDETLTHTITEQIYSVLKKYSDEIRMDNFRLIENGLGFSAAFDMVYPAGLQKREDEIRNSVTEKVRSEIPDCHLTIKGILRRERLSLHR
ncbi:MAG: hypothetical protein K2K63_04665, partial [Acetatifactor sp.]|nr:hypothetical protein [Acetatifactor sp.]